MTHVTIETALLEQLVVALEGIEALIEHQYTGTREAMNALQDASDDAQETLTAGRAALANAEPTGWQPIETAPKDMGSHLFLCNNVAVQGFLDATGRLYVCMEAGAAGNPPWRLMRRSPTHWMPLPNPPEKQP